MARSWRPPRGTWPTVTAASDLKVHAMRWPQLAAAPKIAANAGAERQPVAEGESPPLVAE
jgi:hypothetical protein